jgi:predicted DNA-binding protein (UPF0251 family)
MPRPRRRRRIQSIPDTTYFKPAGIRLRDLKETVLTFEELESIRLRDYQGLSQIQSAKKMDVSQPTFQRMYESARKKIADALIRGNAIKIEGGTYRISKTPKRNGKK